MPDRQRSNIVIIMVEQLSALADPSYAPSAAELPGLQRLAETSVRYDRAWCNAPVCGPSRLSFLSGRFAHRVQAYDNGSILPAHVPTFAHALTAGGYRTFMCGRMHIHGLDQYAGFEARLASEIANPLLCNPADWPARDPAPQTLPPAPAGFNPRARFRSAQIHQHDAFVTQQACRFLREQADAAQPFMMTVGYMAAHSGCRDNPALEPMYEKYLRRELAVPCFTPEDFERTPAHLRRLLKGEQSTGAGMTAAVLDPEYQRHRLALYLASCEYADQQISQVLAALAASGLEERTAVIVTADHGETMGHYGIWGKMNFLEPTQRVPLYLRAPGIAAQVPGVVREPVSLVDVFPTLMELGGVEAHLPLDGRSLLAAPAAPRPIFGEYHGYRAAGGVYAVIGDNRYKYVHHVADGCELFDLQEDPEQRQNRTTDPALTQVRQRCAAQLAEIIDIPMTERLVHEHNQQRAATYAALTASPRIMTRAARRTDDYRQRVNEPWWDGGAYNAPHEPKVIAEDGHPKIGLPD